MKKGVKFIDKSFGFFRVKLDFLITLVVTTTFPPVNRKNNEMELNENFFVEIAFNVVGSF